MSQSLQLSQYLEVVKPRLQEMESVLKQNKDASVSPTEVAVLIYVALAKERLMITRTE